MSKPQIKTTEKVVPMIYAYSTPEIKRHDGWTKIGYTEQEVVTRIRQQTHTADVRWNLEWSGNAVFDDGSGELFRDTHFHVYLRKQGIEQEEGADNEWFHVDGRTSKGMFWDFRENRGILKELDSVIPYRLREEQNAAVEQTLNYFRLEQGREFLWNAKPRFGKTLAVYDFIRRAGFKKVLVVTNRPAIANSWYDDYARFLGPQSGYLFVSEVDALRWRKAVLTRDEYSHALDSVGIQGCIEFVSLQDLKGSIHFGGHLSKLLEVAELAWDVLVIDEAHEGVDTYKTDVAFEQITRRFTLHLSGTPFKALANAKFPDAAIFNWTYADEQQRKQDWEQTETEWENPYSSLPKLNLFTYRMSDIVRDKLQQGIEIDGQTEEYAFDLNEFFAVDGNGRFKYADSVDRFLDALTLQEKYPFSTPELRDELKHTFWLLNRVDSAKALAKKLKEHPVFKDYQIELAAGDGKLDDADETKKSYDKVVEAIKTYDKTITLSVGQLTTGVTIPEWSAVLMLSNIKSPALYMQAAFRAQNPCLYQRGTEVLRKENAYVFDFDPARTLTIYEEFANDLIASTAAGRGDAETRQQNIRTLLNFFPVIGEDEEGKLIELDAEKVLAIPRKIRSQEVVRRGFMSNFLFQNISNIFSAPAEVVAIVNTLQPVKEPLPDVRPPKNPKEELSLDSAGNVDVPTEIVIGEVNNIFGDKIYDSAAIVAGIATSTPDEGGVSKVKDVLQQTTEKIAQQVFDHYGDQVAQRAQQRITKRLAQQGNLVVDKAKSNFDIQTKIIENKRLEALQNRHETGRSAEEIEAECAAQQQQNVADFRANLTNAINDLVNDVARETVQTVENNIREQEKESIEDSVRDHLRGFSRTIPAFLMAYGNDEVCLANFDQVIPDDVFLEVTGITTAQFRFLRDGGEYVDTETQETKTFGGQLFDPIVFDDSVKEFMALKVKLANYFDEEMTEDIFDYIPPQKTNQIFTPRLVVKRMVDMLEEESPGCFDDPTKTFADLYMKSGLYVAEIVKRLYRSAAMKTHFPDDAQRLRHIFEHQVYGLAPTEIIFRIATNFILGFEENIGSVKHHFCQLDALPLAQTGTLEQELDRVFTADM